MRRAQHAVLTGVSAHPATQGAEINFGVQLGEGAAGPAGQIQVYTTRPDTLFGATYLVLAPEHPMLQGLTAEAQRAEVTAYVEAAARKSDLERTELQKDKSGVFTGGGQVHVCALWCRCSCAVAGSCRRQLMLPSRLW